MTTTPTIALADLAESGPDVDMLRQMAQFMAQRLMEIDVEGRCGAGYDEKSAERTNSRNGYRDRTWETRAGTVELKIAIGDEVYGMVRFPSFGESAAYAEVVAAPASDLARKPADIDHVHAAGAPMALLTAWQFLVELGHDEPNPLGPQRHRPVPLAGKTVLVNGAAGGVGHFAVQVAKLQGARVIAVASGAHEAFLRGLGVDDFIDYRKTAPEDAARGIDLVLDIVGGPTTGRFLKTLKPGGALFPVFPLGFTGADDAARQGFTVSATQVRSSGAQLAELGKLLDDGTIRVAVDSTFALEDARLAHERAARGHIQGKIVLTVR